MKTATKMTGNVTTKTNCQNDYKIKNDNKMTGNEKTTVNEKLTTK